MFNKTNISKEEYSTFYHHTSGIYKAYTEIIEEKKKELIIARKDYKEFKSEYYKKEIKNLNQDIKELQIKKKMLEFLYNTTFNEVK